MKIIQVRNINKGIGILLATILITYLLPSLLLISGYDVKLLLANVEGWTSLKRSIAFASWSTIINVSISLLIAVLLHQISLKSSKGGIISILIIPVMLGNVSIAFSFPVAKLISNPTHFTNLLAY